MVISGSPPSVRPSHAKDEHTTPCIGAIEWPGASPSMEVTRRSAGSSPWIESIGRPTLPWQRRRRTQGTWARAFGKLLMSMHARKEHKHAYTHKHVTYTYIYIYIHTYICTYIYIYTYTHIYIYTVHISACTLAGDRL